MGRSVSSIDVTLCISADEFMRHYQGSARAVMALADDGRTLRFPTKILQTFVTRDGIDGRFRIFFDGDGRFERIERLAQ